jgi:DNA replication licensing factor MCM6
MVDGDPTEEDSYFDTVNAQAGSPARPSRAQPGQGERGPSSPNGAAVTPPPAEAKRKMKITHDRYMTLQNLIVMHLAELERTTGKGLDRDDLIDWYLELNEAEFQDVEQLDYEKELIAKVLKKLVKVLYLRIIRYPYANLLYKDNYLLEIRGDVQNSLPTSEEEPPSETNGEVRVHYMVHPSVDTGESSSLA